MQLQISGACFGAGIAVPSAHAQARSDETPHKFVPRDVLCPGGNKACVHLLGDVVVIVIETAPRNAVPGSEVVQLCK